MFVIRARGGQDCKAWDPDFAQRNCSNISKTVVLLLINSFFPKMFKVHLHLWIIGSFTNTADKTSADEYISLVRNSGEKLQILNFSNLDLRNFFLQARLQSYKSNNSKKYFWISRFSFISSIETGVILSAQNAVKLSSWQMSNVGRPNPFIARFRVKMNKVNAHFISLHELIQKLGYPWLKLNWF